MAKKNIFKETHNINFVYNSQVLTILFAGYTNFPY